MNRMTQCFSLFAAALFSLSVQAGTWTIDNDMSKVSFVSTKNVNIAEVNHFGRIDGGVDERGHFSLDIDLASVDTGIEIRDERMREFLFDVIAFPKAVLSAQIDMEAIEQLPVARSMTLQVEGEFSLHGQQKTLPLEVLVTRIAEDELLVISSRPVVLEVGDYELVQGVEKLRELAGLPNISHAVPVSFYLTLNASN